VKVEHGQSDVAQQPPGFINFSDFNENLVMFYTNPLTPAGLHKNNSIDTMLRGTNNPKFNRDPAKTPKSFDVAIPIRLKATLRMLSPHCPTAFHHATLPCSFIED
jgi:hypothetical protein